MSRQPVHNPTAAGRTHLYARPAGPPAGGADTGLEPGARAVLEEILGFTGSEVRIACSSAREWTARTSSLQLET